jgi:broad specificity phosphatase PhoE
VTSSVNRVFQKVPMHRRPFLRWLAIVAAPILPVRAAVAPSPLALLRRGGHVILMRHAATVPGIGDPAGFVLEQCGTQRNLSAAGRQDATRIGAAFTRLGIPVDQVRSSRWCRCLDTATLAFGRATPEPLLDSLFQEDAGATASRLRAAHAWLATLRLKGNIVLVTHDVNIRALVGNYVEQGDMVVASIIENGALRVAGVLKRDAL